MLLSCHPREIGFDARKDGGGLGGAEFGLEPVVRRLVALALIAAIYSMTQRNYVGRYSARAIRTGHGQKMIHCQSVEESSRPTTYSAATIKIFKRTIPLLISQGVWQIPLARVVALSFYSVCKRIAFSLSFCRGTHRSAHTFDVYSSPLLFSLARLFCEYSAASLFFCRHLLPIVLTILFVPRAYFLGIGSIIGTLFSRDDFSIGFEIFAHAALAMRGEAVFAFPGMKISCIGWLISETFPANLESLAGNQDWPFIPAIFARRHKSTLFGPLCMKIFSCCREPFCAFGAAFKRHIIRCVIMGLHRKFTFLMPRPRAFPRRWDNLFTPVIIPYSGGIE